MKKDTFTQGSNVIISNNGRREVALVTRAYMSKGQQVYDVYTERGSFFTKISTDNQKLLIFIDEVATIKFSNRINTKLSLNVVNEKINSYEIIDGDFELPGDKFNDDSTPIEPI